MLENMGNPTQVKHSHPFIRFIARVTQFNKTAGFLHQGATFGPIGFGFRSSGDLSVVVAGVAVAVVSVGVVGVANVGGVADVVGVAGGVGVDKGKAGVDLADGVGLGLGLSLTLAVVVAVDSRVD